MGMQEEDCFAVNRWILPHLKDCRPRRFRAQISRVLMIFLGLCALVCCGVGAPIARADDAANEAARELARKLAAQLDPEQSLQLEFLDRIRSLSSADFLEAERQLSEEIQTRGFRVLANPPADVTIRISFSEDLTNQLWVASFSKDGLPVAIIVPFPRTYDARLDSSRARAVRIQARLVFELPDTILDFIVLNKRSEPTTQMLVLGTDSISLYELTNGQWQARSSERIPHKNPLPRDPRGMLWASEGFFWAGTPGTTCEGTIRDQRLSMKCDTSAKKWFYSGGDVIFVDQELAAGRNYFVTRNEKNEVVETFFSKSRLYSTSGSKTVAAELGNPTRPGAPGVPVALPIRDAGGDFAGIPMSCAMAGVALVTGDGDFTVPDSLGAFLSEDGRRVQAGPRIELNGPVTAIWDDEPGLFVIPRMIVRNLRSGHYEAYQITLACDR
jgi:hypothetical protein